ncbi:protein kinase domain-containing protein [Citrus sinensis]|uniref:Protein kinase domain-containing protein n=1 Tax=Citrus sinensis TaxID=2711 RepID=A0ACB8LD82_CITSI|nr:protein kinase domain-containing protein [Citrus sinensis]
MSNDFQNFLQNEGIISQKTCPDTPQQNGIAERKNRHLLDVTRALLLDASVPSHFWVEALSTTVHLINCMPSFNLYNESPYFRLHNKHHDYTQLRIFGCICYCHLPASYRNKLTAQSSRCAFLGYASDRKGFLCYDPNARRTRISRNVIFVENIYFFQNTHVTTSLSPCSNLHDFDSDIPNKARFNLGIEMAKMTTFRTLLAIAGSQAWPLFQMDVKNVFLHGDLQEEVYMKLPPESSNDPSMFIRRSAAGIIILLVYVDDIIITGTDTSDIQQFKESLHSYFQIKDLGNLIYFLGLEVHRSSEGIYVHQHKYTKDLIALARLEDSTIKNTPLEINVKYSKDDGDLLSDPTLYRKLVGSWCMYLGNSFVSWKCKKQERVSKSSTEAEYRAMSGACSEIVWLRRLVSKLGFPQASPTLLHVDHKSAIQITENPVFHEITKHIEVDCHYIRDAYADGTIQLPHVSTTFQIADIFTKSLTKIRHQFLIGKLKLVDSPASI